MVLKALLVDFDGTLADSSQHLYKAYETVLKKRGLSPSNEEFQALTGPTIREAATILQKKYHLQEDIYPEWVSFLLPFYENEIEPIAAAEEIMEFAKGRFRLALVTSAERQFVMPFLKKYQFHFDELICKEDFKASKPDPDPYLTALARLKIDPDEALAIEDSKNGALSAIRAGLKTFLITEKEQIMKFLKKNYG